MSENATSDEAGMNVREWNNPRRRTAGLVALTLAVIVLAADLVVYFVVGAMAWLDWTLVGVIVLVLLFVIVLLAAKPRAAATAVAQEAHLGPGAPATLSEATLPPSAPTSGGLPAITLRCGDCGTIFDVTDTGERPLYHTCPGCGAEGVLKEPAAPAAAPAAAESAPSMYAPQAAPAPEPAAPAAPAPTVRKLKLRCGNCKQVFAIEDTGERPLRRPCPYCNRMGEIR